MNTLIYFVDGVRMDGLSSEQCSELAKQGKKIVVKNERELVIKAQVETALHDITDRQDMTALSASIKTLQNSTKYGKKNASGRYSWNVVQLAVEGAALTPNQIAWVIRTAGEVRYEREQIRKRIKETAQA